MKKVLWIDTETTGLEVEKHGLREVACLVEIDNVVVDEFSFNIDTTTYKNEKYISKYVRKAMGVTEDKLSEYNSSAVQIDYFISKIKKYTDLDDKNDKFIMAGFNVGFDFDFIEDWFKDNLNYVDFDYSFGYQKIDVLELVRNFKYLDLFETKNNKLETLCKYFNIEIDAHKALSDIKATKELHSVLAHKYVIKNKEI